MISRRQLIQVPALALPVVGAAPAWSQQYPAKPIRMLVSAQAGTTVDVVARFISEPLSKRLNTPVLIDNRPGAGGAIGSDALTKSPADGYTMVFTGITHFTARYSGEVGINYDPVKDFIGVAKMCSAALAIVVPTDSPYKTLQDLIRAMKAKPGEINYATGGAGSTSHLCTVIMNDMTGTTAKHIPYKGNTQAVTDTAAGVVAFTSQGSGGVLPLIQAGKLRALAVSSRNRWESLPNVPTGIESGIPGFEVASWMAAFAPAGTPAPVVRLVSDEMARIGRSPEFKEFCNKQAMFVDLMESREFNADLPKEEAHWKRVTQLLKAA